MPLAPGAPPLRARGRATRTSEATFAAIALLLVACSGPSPSLWPVGSVGSAEPTRSPDATASQGSASTPSPSSAPSVGTSPDRLRIELFADGLADPIGITAAGDGSGRLFVNERGGRIRVVTAAGELLADPFVDLSDRILSGGERGLLGLAFHPDFERNGRLFVHYSRAGDGATVISELRAAGNHQRADADGERVLLTYTQPFANHNGGQIEFGPDGYLYIGLGDGGSGGDPLNNGQNREVLLGKILRIDIDGTPTDGLAYAIPRDNPHAPNGADPGDGQPEIWAIGLRNPWRFSFDLQQGDLYIADVGQGSWEEIDRQPADSAGGENYGWNVMEGSQCFRGECDPTGYVLPIAEYGHDLGSCSVTGGYVYRGEAQPALRGSYVFGDYCSGIVFTLNVDADTVTRKQVLESGLQIAAFGIDEAGELYIVDLGGAIYRVLVDG